MMEVTFDLAHNDGPNPAWLTDSLVDALKATGRKSGLIQSYRENDTMGLVARAWNYNHEGYLKCGVHGKAGEGVTMPMLADALEGALLERGSE